MFYINRGILVVGKAEKQAIRWELKVDQSADKHVLHIQLFKGQASAWRKRRCRVLTSMFYTFNYLKDRQVHGEKGGVERMAHLDSKTQTQPLRRFEKCLQHTRAMKSHFWSEEQTSLPRSTSLPRFTMALNSSENGDKYATP